MKKAVLLLIPLLFFCFPLFAQVNSYSMLDSSFNKDGKAVTPQTYFASYAQVAVNSLVLLNDGKIIAAGGIPYYILAKYLPDGKLDKSFGDSGIVYTSFNEDRGNLYEIKKQSSNKIVAIGSLESDTKVSYNINRYNANGSIDATFAKNGWLTLPSPGYSIAILPDDKIIVCGEVWKTRSGSHAITLRRYLKNGETDSSFGTNGLTTVQLGSKRTFGQYPSVALDNRGRIVVGCYSILSNVSGNGIVIARFKSNGFPDSTFNGNGITTGIYKGTSYFINKIAVQANNKIVAGGSTASLDKYVITRFNETGEEDKGFGDNGIVASGITIPGQDINNSVIKDLNIQDDGKIIAVGYLLKQYFLGRFIIVRYLTNGQPDKTFGYNGQAVTNIESGDSRAYAIAIQPDGDILSGGYTRKDKNMSGAGGYFALVRYLKTKKISNLIVNENSISKTNADTLISFFPNPSKNIIFIKGLQTLHVQYYITDQNGIIIQSNVITKAQIDVHLLYTGMYYLKIWEDKRSTVFKFVKE